MTESLCLFYGQVFINWLVSILMQALKAHSHSQLSVNPFSLETRNQIDFTYPTVDRQRQTLLAILEKNVPKIFQTALREIERVTSRPTAYIQLQQGKELENRLKVIESRERPFLRYEEMKHEEWLFEEGEEGNTQQISFIAICLRVDRHNTPRDHLHCLPKLLINLTLRHQTSKPRPPKHQQPTQLFL